MGDITKRRYNYRDLQKENALNFEHSPYGDDLSMMERARNRNMIETMSGSVRTIPYEELMHYGDIGSSKYDVDTEIPEYYLNNLESWRGENQSAGRQWVHGITKGVGLAATTFLDGTLGLLYGIAQGLGEGRVSALWDNDVSNALQDFNEGMEKVLPNYKTQEQQENSWWQNIDTANFWADGFLKNLGFTVGAFYSGNTWLKGLKALGWVKNAVPAQVVGSVLSGFNEGRIEANNAQREFLNSENTKLQQAREARAMEIANDGRISDDVKVEMLKTLDDNVKIAQDNMLERAHKMGLATLIGNTVILSLDNLWQFGKLYSRGFENAKDLSGRIMAGQLRNGITGNIREGYTPEIINGGKRFLRGASNGLSEGFEEMNQAWISEGTGYWMGADSPDAYYKALIDPKARVDTQTFMGAVGEGFVNTYGNGDRWEEFAVGALTGLMGMPTFGKLNNSDANTWIGKGKAIGISGGIIGEMRSQAQRNAELKESTDIMNSYLDKIRNYGNYFSQSQSFTNAMDGFAEEADEFQYKNMANNDDFAAISRFARTGRLDDLKELVNQDFANMSDEQLEQIARNTTPNLIIKDDGTVSYEDSEGNTANGGWRDPVTGKLMSDTEEGREKMKQELQKKKDKILYEIDKYEEAVREVRAIGNDSLEESQVNELAWLKWKFEMFNSRYQSIKKKQEEALSRMLNASERYSDRAKRDLDTYNAVSSAVKTEIENITRDITETEALIKNLETSIANKDANPILEEHINKFNQMNAKIDAINASKSMRKREKRRKIAQLRRAMEASIPVEEIIRTKEELLSDYRDYLEAQKRRLSDLQDTYKDMQEHGYKKEELEFGEYLQKIAENMSKFLTYISSSNNPLEMAARIETNKDFLDWANDDIMKELLINEMGITDSDYDKIIHDLKDTAKIAKAAKQFKDRYKEFSENPIKIAKNRTKIEKTLTHKVEQVKEKIQQKKTDSIAKRFDFNGSITDIAATLEENTEDINNVGGIDEWLEKLPKEQQDKIRKAVKFNRAKEGLKKAFDETDDDRIMGDRTRKFAKTVVEEAAKTSDDLDSLIEAANNLLNSDFLDKLIEEASQGFNEAARIKYTASTKEAIKEILDGVKAPLKKALEISENLGKIEEKEKETAKKASKLKSQHFADKDESPEPNGTIIKEPKEAEEFKTSESNTVPVTMLAKSIKEIMDFNLGRKMTTIHAKESRPVSKRNAKNYNKPQLSEYKLEAIDLETYLQYIKNNSDAIPTLTGGYTKDQYIHYIEVVYNYLKDNGAFDYVKNKLKKGQKLEFYVDDDLSQNVGTAIVLIRTADTKQIVGSMPSDIDFKSITKGEKDPLIKKEPTKYKLYKDIVDAHNKAKESSTEEVLYTTEVEDLMGGNPAWSNRENSIQDIFDNTGETPIIGIVQSDGFIHPADERIGDIAVDVLPGKLKQEGQVYVLIPSGSKKYIPALVWNMPLQEVLKRYGEDDWYIQKIVDKLMEAPLKINQEGSKYSHELFRWLMLNGLNVRAAYNEHGKWKTDTSRNLSKATHIEIVFDTKKNGGVPMYRQIKITDRKLSRSEVLEVVKNIIANSSETTTNVIISEMNSPNSGDYLEHLSKYMYTNIVKGQVHTINDWFTYKEDNSGRPETKKGLNKTNSTLKETRRTITLNGQDYNISDTNSTITKQVGTSEVVLDPSSDEYKEIIKLLNPTTTSSNENSQQGQNAMPVTKESLEMFVDTMSDASKQKLPNKKTPKNLLTVTRVHEESVTTESVLYKDMEKLKSMFPQLNDAERIVLVNGLIKTTDNNNNPVEAYGMFLNGVIYISSESPRGTAFHEAFHYISNMLMEDAEREQMFKEAEVMYGSDDRMELEEKLAEDFRHYMNGMTDNSIKGFLKRIFERLKHIINSIMGNKNKANNLFYDIYRDSYKRRIERKSASIEGVEKVILEEKDTFEDDLLDYKYRKTDYSKLDTETKEYLTQRGISEEKYNSMAAKQREIILQCM